MQRHILDSHCHPFSPRSARISSCFGTILFYCQLFRMECVVLTLFCCCCCCCCEFSVAHTLFPDYPFLFSHSSRSLLVFMCFIKIIQFVRFFIFASTPSFLSFPPSFQNQSNQIITSEYFFFSFSLLCLRRNDADHSSNLLYLQAFICSFLTITAQSAWSFPPPVPPLLRRRFFMIILRNSLCFRLISFPLRSLISALGTARW